MGGTSMKDVRGAVLAGSTPPFLGRERAAVDVDVGPERRSPRYHVWISDLKKNIKLRELLNREESVGRRRHRDGVDGG